jgi:hypothetical protein
MESQTSAEVQRLINIFNQPSEVLVHKQAGSNEIALCCQSVSAYFSGRIEAAIGKYGLFGALDVLTKSSGWGHARCNYLCECYREIR